MLRPTSLALALILAAPLLAMNHAGRPEDLRPFAAAETPGGPGPGDLVPNFRLTDHRGTTRELYYESTVRAVVLVFTGTGSPRAMQTAASLRALRARYAAADVIIWQIDSSAAVTAAALSAEQALFNNDLPVLRDEAQLVASELAVTRQTEAFVLSPGPGSVILYRGPLDNADPASFAAATENHVAAALDAALAGRTPARARLAMPAPAPRIDLPPAPSINYATDVAPVVQRRCISCHSPGNIAPHSYTRFEDLASRANSIRAAVLTRRMAPWHADAEYGAWSNGVALTPLESATLHAWVKAGAPRGSGADPIAAVSPAAAAAWPLGQPDLVLTIPRQSIPATGKIDYAYLTVAVPVDRERWLKAAVVRPGNPKIVHHALVFEGTLFDVLAAAGGQGGFFAGYVPGLAQTWYPAGSGKRVRKDSALTFQMHYTTTGTPETDETQIGLYFTDTAPARELQTRSAYSPIIPVNTISIPARAREYQREASFTPSATRDVMLYELSPHMHYRGKWFRYDALYPDGTSETLLNVPQYDFNWQSGYRLTEAKRLPAGTQIRVRGAFDNSPQNPFNPNPNVVVRGGDQTDDEMFIGYINYAELGEKVPARAPSFAANFSARARVGEAFRMTLDAGTATSVTAAGLPDGLSLSGNVISGTPKAAGRSAVRVTAANAVGSAASLLDLTVASATGAPEFTAQPRGVRARLGATVTFTAAVAASPATTYTWFVRGGEFCNTEGPVLTLANVTAAHAGDWVCVATNAAGSTRSEPASLSLEFSGLVNLSARASVGTGANVVIPGITVRGTKPKTLLIRAAGPALAAFGVGGTLANPVLGVFDAAGDRVLANDNWSEVPNLAELRAATAAQGAFTLPEGGRDAAMLVTLPPGGYTVQVAGAGTGAAAQGVAIVEVYEADANPSTLVNLSCRANVGVDDNILIAGFAISGSAPKRVLIRGVGPTLGALGVTGVLADPRLEVINQATGAIAAANDNWTTDLTSVFSSVGAFALNPGSADAAVVVTLPPGAYTAKVSGANRGTGVALVEVYELP
ncbi:MAG: immunoglobulin domain-containing protein [Opitutaceae bacterium]